MAANKRKYNFNNEDVPLQVLKKNAYNYRWASVQEGVIPLTAADPDFQIADEIIDALNNYIADKIFSYGPPVGLPIFKESISQWHLKTKGSNFHFDSILPVNSAAGGLFIAAAAVLKKGDQAIVFEPVDFLFRKAIENSGAEVITSTLNKKTGEINFEELATKKSARIKAIFICNPNNPLGKTVSISDLLQLGEFAKEINCTIISDEIWGDIDYGHSFTSIAKINEDFKNRTIIVSGLSKNFGLAGLRIGYICVQNKLLFKKIFQSSLHQCTAAGISTLSQIAGAAALNNGFSWLEGFMKHLHKAKSYTEERLSKMSLFSSNHPNSTYLIFPKIENCNLNSEQLCNFILKNAKVALIPGGNKWFEHSSEGHVRICYATSLEILEESFDRIENALKKLNP